MTQSKLIAMGTAGIVVIAVLLMNSGHTNAAGAAPVTVVNTTAIPVQDLSKTASQHVQLVCQPEDLGRNACGLPTPQLPNNVPYVVPAAHTLVVTSVQITGKVGTPGGATLFSGLFCRARWHMQLTGSFPMTALHVRLNIPTGMHFRQATNSTRPICPSSQRITCVI